MPNLAGVVRRVVAPLPLLLVVVLGAGCSDAPAPSNPTRFAYDVPLDPASPWPKFRRDSAQTGRSPVRPLDDGSAAWSFATGNGIFSSPVIGGDGTIYFGDNQGRFYAVEPSGVMKWCYETNSGKILNAPAIGWDGTVYVGCDNNKLYAFGP